MIVDKMRAEKNNAKVNIIKLLYFPLIISQNE
jgi:hypothetical protein